MQLSDVPRDWYGEPMGATLRYMIETGFHEWGFRIYRCCAYGDDENETWDRFMATLREEVHAELDFNGRDHVLEQYAQWTVVQDRDALEGASRAEVRRRFREWRDQHAVSRGGGGGGGGGGHPLLLLPLPTDASKRLPRFTYCLYVDQKCLDTLGPHLAAKEANAGNRWGPLPPPLTVAVIDADFQTSDDAAGSGSGSGSGGFPPIDGCTERYVGWQYQSARYLAGMYDELHRGRLDAYTEYKRPPAIGPDGINSIEG